MPPDEVDAWYLGIYADAIEWAVTYTRGMSQWADGGIKITKPYVSSVFYIHKMSNYVGNVSMIEAKELVKTPVLIACMEFFDYKGTFQHNNRMADAEAIDKIPQLKKEEIKTEHCP